ncbi:MAG: class I SAM-dependent methyltransferase [Planctomycetota bacterium]
MTTATEIESERPSARELSASIVGVYGSGVSILKLMQRYRPYICPFELLLEHVPVGSRVLDIGCGGGLFLNLLCAQRRLSDAPGASTGFDLSPDAIEIARTAAERSGHKGVRFVTGDIGKDWPEGPFDVVSMVDVMHHLPPGMWQGVVEQASSRLAPGGVLLYKDMCRRPAWRGLANRTHDLVMARQWITYAPIADVERWCDASGLVVETRGRASRFWYGHEWVVARKTSESKGSA